MYIFRWKPNNYACVFVFVCVYRCALVKRSTPRQYRMEIQNRENNSKKKNGKQSVHCVDFVVVQNFKK